MLRRFALLLCVCLLASMIPAGLAEDVEVAEVFEDAAEVELFETDDQAAEVGEIALEAGDEGASNAADEPAAKGKKTFVVSHGDLVKYNGKGGKVTIPKGVKVIYDRDAFKDNVTELVFPKTMNTIMDEVFADRTKLKKVTFKSDVFLGEFAFSGCTNLKTVVFPKKFTRIGHESFARCKSLKSIKFPSGLKYIDFGAFSSSGLKGTLTFPDKLESIADEIEQELQGKLDREISTVEIGEMVMKRLKEVDEVAYVRFASVYRSFKDINTFMEELSKLLTETK